MFLFLIIVAYVTKEALIYVRNALTGARCLESGHKLAEKRSSAQAVSVAARDMNTTAFKDPKYGGIEYVSISKKLEIAQGRFRHLEMKGVRFGNDGALEMDTVSMVDPEYEMLAQY